MSSDSGELSTWTDARARLKDSREAQALARRMRKAGALHVMVNAREVWSLWPADDASRGALANLRTDLPELDLRFSQVRATDPLAAWREPSPEPVGQGLYLAPAWMGLPSGPGTLVIDALTAFGGGDHPSTRLNLDLICKICQDELLPNAWLADVGSGTGILSLALALKTGCRVLAVDPDPAAERALARNRRLNPLAAPLIHFALATHEALGGPFALAAANLPEPILRMAAEHLAGRLTLGGWLIASGFRNEAEPDLTGYLENLGLAVKLSSQAEGWSGLALQRSPG